MKVLLDTHALVWWFEAKENLSRKAKETIEDSGTVVFVSAASGWELAIKTQIGKFKSAELVRDLERDRERRLHRVTYFTGARSASGQL